MTFAEWPSEELVKFTLVYAHASYTRLPSANECGIAVTNETVNDCTNVFKTNFSLF